MRAECTKAAPIEPCNGGPRKPARKWKRSVKVYRLGPCSLYIGGFPGTCPLCSYSQCHGKVGGFHSQENLRATCVWDCLCCVLLDVCELKATLLFRLCSAARAVLKARKLSYAACAIPIHRRGVCTGCRVSLPLALRYSGAVMLEKII